MNDNLSKKSRWAGHRSIARYCFAWRGFAGEGRSRAGKFLRKVQLREAGVVLKLVRRQFKANAESRYQHRLHCVFLVAVGHSCRSVGRLFGDDPTSVRRWVVQFNVDGPDALRERNRPGRPDGVDTSKLRKLRSELAASPRAFGWDADAWTGGLLSRHLQSVHGVELGLRQSQRLLLKVLRSNQPHSRSGSESSG